VITAVSLIVVLLVLLLGSSVAARNHHASENDEDIFRYPPAIRRSLFVGGLFVVGAGGLVYSTVPPTGAAAAPFVIGGLFGGMALADLYLISIFQNMRCESIKKVYRCQGCGRQITCSSLKFVNLLLLLAGDSTIG
jgi:hypothetical protein